MCARFQSDPRTPHINAVKRIGRYLLHTRDKGLTLLPNLDLTKIDCYGDADFAGAYAKENHDDHNGVRMRHNVWQLSDNMVQQITIRNSTQHNRG
eukprot:1522902-Ditylum_brightwellii.AAC.1